MEHFFNYKFIRKIKLSTSYLLLRQKIVANGLVEISIELERWWLGLFYIEDLAKRGDKLDRGKRLVASHHYWLHS